MGRVGQEYGGKGSRGGKNEESAANKWERAYANHYKAKTPMLDSSGYPDHGNEKVQRWAELGKLGSKRDKAQEKEYNQLNAEMDKQKAEFKNHGKDYKQNYAERTKK